MNDQPKMPSDDEFKEALEFVMKAIDKHGEVTQVLLSTLHMFHVPFAEGEAILLALAGMSMADRNAPLRSVHTIAGLKVGYSMAKMMRETKK